MLNTLYVEPSEADKAQIHAFILDFLNDEEVLQLESEKERIDYLKEKLENISLSLSDAQIKTMLNASTQVAADIETQVLRLQGKKLNPNVKLALQSSLCLAAIYWTPELFALYTSKEILKKILQPKIGKKAADRIDFCATIAAQQICPQYSLLYHLNNVLPESIANLNLLYRLPALVAISLYLQQAAEPVHQLVSAATNQVAQGANLIWSKLPAKSRLQNKQETSDTQIKNEPLDETTKQKCLKDESAKPNENAIENCLKDESAKQDENIDTISEKEPPSSMNVKLK
ncbi:MAG: hypothetical protein JSS07_00525 [Proteobacteria bacterium]|nr:hypothetical protein [Pseudomonadota bacterium]